MRISSGRRMSGASAARWPIRSNRGPRPPRAVELNRALAYLRPRCAPEAGAPGGDYQTTMFDSLTQRFSEVFRGLRGRGRITEANVADAMREVRTALLEADVHV